MTKILIIIGTRPEAIKMAPVFHQLNKFPNKITVEVCLTGQHRQMLDMVTSFFEIDVTYDLDIMKQNQNLFTLSADILNGLYPILNAAKPDWVLVHGDTTTSTISALAAFYAGIKVGHVEAGLRTFNKNSPFPEEMNRILTARISDVHFAPTNSAANNLLNEGVKVENIIVTGNTVIDALFMAMGKIKEDINTITVLKNKIDFSKKIILVTAHRRENFGNAFINICEAIKELSERYKDSVQFVYPVHPNPNVIDPVNRILNGLSNVILVEPLDYEAFVWLMGKSYLILTDSGGVQEEAPSLGKPILVMRENTERPEAVEAGTVILVGTDTKRIIDETIKLIESKELYETISSIHNPYGDGLASERILNFFLTHD